MQFPCAVTVTNKECRLGIHFAAEMNVWIGASSGPSSGSEFDRLLNCFCTLFPGLPHALTELLRDVP